MAELLVARATGIEGFERHVLLKKIRGEQARDARFVEMFLDEARLAASLHHHNIVQVHDIGEDAGEYFFAMEYVHGEDVRKLLAHASDRDRRVPIEHVITIVSCSAAALHHAHEHRDAERRPLGIVHRDVSPANILVGYDGNVKVVDFGIAKATQRTTETHSGLMKGKVAYMSPEQCLGQPVDRRSDIFCLGIVLYELVTVRRLFKGANDFLTMSAIAHSEVPRPSEIHADIAPELEAIIVKALARSPADRYQTADEMRTALERFAAGARLRSSTTALADYMREQFGERPVPWLAGDDDCEIELSIDFDGSATGVVAPPTELSVAARPGSPLMNARNKAITGAPDPSGGLARDALAAIAPLPATARPSAPLPTFLPRAEISRSPVARLRELARRRPRLLTAASAGAAMAVGLALVALAAVGGRDQAAALPVELSVPARPAPPPPPAAEPEPVTPPNLIEMPATAVAEPPPAAATVKKPARPPKKPARAPKGTWDPDALFPTKK